MDASWSDIISNMGVIALLVLILTSGARGVWVWGWHYKDLEHDRDYWRTLALSGTDIAEKTVRIVEREHGTRR